MAHRYARCGDALDDDDTDVDLMYFTEASSDAGCETDSDYPRSTLSRITKSLPLHQNGPPGRAPMAAPLKNKKIYVMFMLARRQGVRAAASCRDYLVNDILPHVSRCDYVHVELMFGDDHTTLLSAMNTNGVIFVDNKRYSPEDYPVVFEVEVSALKYNQTLEFARTFMAGSRYDAAYFYLFCCIGVLGMRCDLNSRADKFTCAAAVAATLSMIGIGDAVLRERLRTDKNITAEQLHGIMDSAFAGTLLISSKIECIRKLDGPPLEIRLA